MTKSISPHPKTEHQIPTISDAEDFSPSQQHQTFGKVCCKAFSTQWCLLWVWFSHSFPRYLHIERASSTHTTSSFLTQDQTPNAMYQILKLITPKFILSTPPSWHHPCSKACYPSRSLQGIKCGTFPPSFQNTHSHFKIQMRFFFILAIPVKCSQSTGACFR